MDTAAGSAVDGAGAGGAGRRAWGSKTQPIGHGTRRRPPLSDRTTTGSPAP